MFLKLVITLIQIFNLVSGPIGGIWLILVGEWRLVILGIVLGIGMPLMYSIIHVPLMGLTYLSTTFAKKGKIKSGTAMYFINMIIEYLIIGAWISGVFLFYINSASIGNEIPYMIFVYSVAIGPLAFMSSKDSDRSIANAIAILLAQTCYIACVILHVVRGADRLIIVVNAALCVIASVCMAYIFYSSVVEQNEYDDYFKRENIREDY
ncbi:MAG: hypothetical protein GF404_09740 [candidate division Zixibacteria bacterium]|nr:hypothetical protein [candidate division Zixibacteria bacterium]